MVAWPARLGQSMPNSCEQQESAYQTILLLHVAGYVAAHYVIRIINAAAGFLASEVATKNNK